MGYEEGHSMIIITMGVTGCGKTTVGQLLAEELGWEFYDADNFHPTENVEKMRRGQSLDDNDRVPWLESLNRVLRKSSNQKQSAVLACSALKKTYRDIISSDLNQICFVFLNGDYELINKRLATRTGHYMNPELLQSQYDTLETPGLEENFICVNIGGSPQSIVDEVKSLMDLS